MQHKPQPFTKIKEKHTWRQKSQGITTVQREKKDQPVRNSCRTLISICTHSYQCDGCLIMGCSQLNCPLNVAVKTFSSKSLMYVYVPELVY